MLTSDLQSYHRTNPQTNIQLNHVDHWTADLVKQHLPPVQVQCGTEIHTAKVSGRYGRFAFVSVQLNMQPFNGQWVSYEFAWGTIANALNTNQPLTIF